MTSIRWPSRSTASTRCSYPLVVAAKPPGNNPSILDNAGLPKTHVSIGLATIRHTDPASVSFSHYCTDHRASAPRCLHCGCLFISHGFVTICYYICIANDWKPLATLGMRMSRNLRPEKGLCDLSALK